MAPVTRVLLCILATLIGSSGRRTQVPRASIRPEPASTIQVSEDQPRDQETASGDATAEPTKDEGRKRAVDKARALLALKKMYDPSPSEEAAEAAEEEEELDYGFFQATAMIVSPESLLVFSLVVAIGSYFGFFELRSKAEVLLDSSNESSDEKIARLQAELAAQSDSSALPQADDAADKQATQLRDVFELAADPACLSELLAEAVPPPNSDDEEPQMTDSLPAFASYRDAVTGDGCNDFTIHGEEMIFDRCYVLKGAVPAGKYPEDALHSMTQRVEEVSTQGNVQLFLQPANEPGMSLLVAILDSDLPSKQVETWQWVTFGILFLCTIFSTNNLSFLVIGSTNLNLDIIAILASTVPAAGIVLSVVFAQEGARRVVASRYGVELSAPYLLPAFPFAPIGTFGALTQRLSASPNKTAEFEMAAAASVAGYIASFAAIVAGIMIGTGPESDAYNVSLNYQLLPVLLRAVVRPFLGDASAVDIDTMDPFAFSANPLLVGGLVGAFLNSLLLLPVGSQDGGILARLAFGDFSGTLSMFAYVLTLFGFFGGGEAGQTYVIFVIALMIFKSGLTEVPPKDSVTDIDGAKRAGAILLIGVGTFLSIPGWPFPYV